MTTSITSELYRQRRKRGWVCIASGMDAYAVSKHVCYGCSLSCQTLGQSDARLTRWDEVAQPGADITGPRMQGA